MNDSVRGEPVSVDKTVRGEPVSMDRTSALDMVSVTILGNNFPVTAAEVVELGMIHRVCEELMVSRFTILFLRVLAFVFLVRLILMVVLEAVVLRSAWAGTMTVSSGIGL